MFAGQAVKLYMPGNAESIRIRAYTMTGLFWAPEKLIMNETSVLGRCYRITGTSLSSGRDYQCN